MKRVIINADDFGLSNGINEGIVKAHREGILTSATLMANMDGFDQAVDLCKANKTLGVGIHMNLLRGRPVLPKSRVRTLLKGECFIGNASLFLTRLFARRIDLNEVEKEWRTQIEKIMKTGINVTHLDSEKHLHCFPALSSIAVRLAQEHNINRIRIIDEPVSIFSNSNQEGTHYLFNPQLYKIVCLNYFCRKLRKKIKNSGIKTPDHFYGVLYSGGMDKKIYDMIFKMIDHGVTEIMCHPGYMPAAANNEIKEAGGYYLNQTREMELQALLDPILKKKIREFGLDLISYGDL